MNNLHVLWTALAVTALATVAVSQEQAPNDAEPAEVDSEVPTNDELDLDIDEWELPEIPAGIFGDDVFIPTEEIPADEEVTFPVDI